MTTTTRDAQALTYLATRIREDTHGCGKWDQNGTYSVIAELVGQNLGDVIRRVIGHASDPEARTPGAIKRPFVPAPVEDPKAPPRPPKPAECCRLCGRALHSPDAVCDEPTTRPMPKAPPTDTYLAAKNGLTA